MLLVNILLIPIVLMSTDTASHTRNPAAGSRTRSEAREAYNFFFGAGPSASFFKKTDDTTYPILLSPSINATIGVRKHLGKRIGIKGESQISIGPTYGSLGKRVADTAGGSEKRLFRSSSGFDGQTIYSNLDGSVILGPFGRMAFDLGLGCSFDYLTSSNIVLTGKAGRYAVRLDRNHFILNYSIGGSLYLGKEDQYVFSLGEIAGVRPNHPSHLSGKFYLTYSYAWRI